MATASPSRPGVVGRTDGLLPQTDLARASASGLVRVEVVALHCNPLRDLAQHATSHLADVLATPPARCVEAGHPQIALALGRVTPERDCGSYRHDRTHPARAATRESAAPRYSHCLLELRRLDPERSRDVQNAGPKAILRADQAGGHPSRSTGRRRVSRSLDPRSSACDAGEIGGREPNAPRQLDHLAVLRLEEVSKLDREQRAEHQRLVQGELPPARLDVRNCGPRPRHANASGLGCQAFQIETRVTPEAAQVLPHDLTDWPGRKEQREEQHPASMVLQHGKVNTNSGGRSLDKAPDARHRPFSIHGNPMILTRERYGRVWSSRSSPHPTILTPSG